MSGGAAGRSVCQSGDKSQHGNISMGGKAITANVTNAGGIIINNVVLCIVL